MTRPAPIMHTMDVLEQRQLEAVCVCELAHAARGVHTFATMPSSRTAASAPRKRQRAVHTPAQRPSSGLKSVAPGNCPWFMNGKPSMSSIVFKSAACVPTPVCVMLPLCEVGAICRFGTG